MSKRLAAMTISEAGQSGALLPPPPTAAKLEPRSLSGPLHEGSCSAEAAAQTNDMQHADEAAEAAGKQSEESGQGGAMQQGVQRNSSRSMRSFHLYLMKSSWTRRGRKGTTSLEALLWRSSKRSECRMYV